ncbi:MAG TPA: hypothetical protein VF517_14750 [Thermoleophilaceae bacterium]|jgi:hypothetical protein
MRRSRLRRLRIPLSALAIAVAAALGVSANDDGPGGESRAAAGQKPVDPLIDAMRARYPEIQRPNGHFRSSIGGGTRYGNAYMGYALLMSGVRTGDDAAVEAGLRGLTNPLQPGRRPNRPSVFESLALAAGYNIAREHAAGEPLFKRFRAAWEDFLRDAPLIRLPAVTYYGNHWLIEAVEIRELLATGLRSESPTSVLGGQRANADRLSSELINKRIPAMARAEAVAAPNGRAFVLSDPPDNPLAYQGLSLGFYARGVELLGDEASDAARRTLAEVARASLLLAAPDGDVAYFGRNQEQAWGLAGTVYGAYAAADLDETGSAEDGQLRELASRALQRLLTVHGVTHWGLEITPSVARSRWVPPAGLDSGAGGPSFGGLVLALLEWARDESREPPDRVSIPADRPLRTKLSHAESRFTVIRRGPVWAVIRPTISGKYPYDVRYDFGVVAMKVLRSDRWVDVLRHRPFTAADPDSAGPILRTGGVPAFPFASDVGVAPNGAVTMRGGWRLAPTRVKRVVATLPDGGKVRALGSIPGAPVRTGVVFRFEPTDCGMQLTFPVQAGDAIEYSAFLAPRGLRTGPRRLEDANGAVTFSRPARVATEQGYASGVEPALVRARAGFDALAAGPLTITHCAQPGPLPADPLAPPLPRG